MAAGTQLILDKILNNLPIDTGISIQDLSKRTEMKYHTTRNYVIKLIEQGKAYEFDKTSKTILYSAYAHTTHDAIPRGRNDAGKTVTVGHYSMLIVDQGTKFPQFETLNGMQRLPIALSQLCHEMIRACEGQEVDPTRIDQVRNYLTEMLGTLDRQTISIRGWLNNESAWKIDEYYKFNSDPMYKKFSNLIKQAHNIIQDREVYSQEMMYVNTEPDPDVLSYSVE